MGLHFTVWIDHVIMLNIFSCAMAYGPHSHFRTSYFLQSLCKSAVTFPHIIFFHAVDCSGSGSKNTRIIRWNSHTYQYGSIKLSVRVVYCTMYMYSSSYMLCTLHGSWSTGLQESRNAYLSKLSRAQISARYKPSPFFYAIQKWSKYRRNHSRLSVEYMA